MGAAATEDTLRLASPKEWGPARAAAGRPPLVYPYVAHWTPLDTCLVVDRCLPRNRIVEVDLAGRVVWEHEAAPRLNYAERVSADLVVATHRQRLVRFGPGGRRDEAPLPTPFPPNAGSVDADGRLLLAGDDGIWLVELDGSPVAHVAPSEDSLVAPVDVHAVRGGGFVCADGIASCVVEIDASGRRLRVLGRWRAPGSGNGRLNAPQSACRLADGATLVADTRSHRVVEYDPDGEIARVVSARTAGVDLFSPGCVRPGPDDTIVVADTGNRRILRLTRQGEVVWRYGPADAGSHLLSFPRSAQALPSGRVLVCDSSNDRVVELEPGGTVAWSFGGGDAGLKLPRSATRSPEGSTAISDGLNGRVVVADRAGRVARELTAVDAGGRRLRLGDPHHAEVLADGSLFVVDSGLDAVFLLDRRGAVVRWWGRGRNGEPLLRDPHTARPLPSGGLLVADSGNERIVCFADEARIAWSLETLSERGPDGWTERKLSYPRFVDALPDGRLLVVDSNGNRAVVADRHGRILWSVGPQLPMPATEPAFFPELRVPKWASLSPWGTLLVTDYYNSRIVEVPVPAGVRSSA